MPELPEVQTTVNGINSKAKGLVITDVWTIYNSSFHSGKDNIKDPAYFKKFKKAIIGTKIVSASRRAKNILIHLSSGDIILIHMKMTGHIMYGSYVKQNPAPAKNKRNKFDNKKTLNVNTNLKGWDNEYWAPQLKNSPLADPFNRFIRLVFTFSNGKNLALSDMRKFAKVTLLQKREHADLEKSNHIKHLGIEPFDKGFTFENFKKIINKKPNGRIKNVLMDQSLICGVGNIYSDESLWYSNIHPESKPSRIPDKNLKPLHKAILETLKSGIEFGGDSMQDYRNINGEPGKFQTKHKVYQRKGERCFKKGCGGKITRKVVGGRSAHFCDKHQILF